MVLAAEASAVNVQAGSLGDPLAFAQGLTLVAEGFLVPTKVEPLGPSAEEVSVAILFILKLAQKLDFCGARWSTSSSSD